ncbi:serine/threonine-protein phosphatase 4 regulatory subunit 2 isoform X1 [Culex quinquefasciatus]|uniref:serine/threonine-protein phosphatase 4 regulatory subunit 2 isoform X1 n=1 Tax=Culex quinquefasciatus TaxID=7176 RepID=UPI0018E29DFE|nr:serine/threonine-protein phosphatase 4 regulatory subunit 2 isoform X1 [Culex quinquefasciatus]
MENPEEVLQLLERFTKLKQKEIPRELDDYLGFVARTGDTVYRWAIVKHLFREKLVHVITDFHDNTPSIADLPQCPNVDPFNYERMKRILLDRLDAFNSAPFTVQRICELLTEPRKQYTRIDKYMRAVEKNILVVSTQEPGRRRSESENGDSLDSIVNGDLEVNVDIEMDNEAFGIDSGGEIVPAAAAAPVVTAEPAEPSPVSEEEPARGVVGVTEEPEVSKEAVDEVAATPATEPAIADKEEESKEGPGEEPLTVNPSAEDGQPEADIPKEDPKLAEEINEPAEPLVPQLIEEPSTAEDLPVPEVQPPLIPTETDSTNDPSPVEESHDKDLLDGSASVESKVEATSDPADDGQPAPKLAKLSDEPVVVEPAVEEAPQTSAVVTDSLVEAEKDDVSSGSTTDSGGSSAASVESEPTVSTTTTTTSSSTDSSTPVEPESAERVAPEEPVPTVESLPEPEKEQPIPCEPVSEVVPTPEVSPSVAPVAEPEPTPVETEPTVKESIEEPAVGVEMETAAVVPENVMATDEEDTIQSPVDAVVPMAADVPEAVKPDDNAMDVDESSVEPMDQ